MSLASDGPNAQQIEYWNEVSGQRWVDMGDIIDTQIAPLGETAMDRAQISPGERILDIGCGCGQTTVELASKVGPDGSVLGLCGHEASAAPGRSTGSARAGSLRLRSYHAEIRTPKRKRSHVRYTSNLR